MSFQDADSSTVKAWDPLLRVFHWSPVFFFLFAFVTEDEWLNIHVQAGMIIIASEGDGPLAGTVFSTLRDDWMKDAHELFANFTLLMVVAHVSSVLVAGFLEGENLVKTMVIGRKKNRSCWADVTPGKGEENQS